MLLWLGQADLLTIGDDVALDHCTVRPFALEEGHFVLLPIVIGDRWALGLRKYFNLDLTPLTS